MNKITKTIKEEKFDLITTLMFDEKNYLTFRKIMKEQNLGVSRTINEFMRHVNSLLTFSDGGEIAFIFEPVKSKEDSKK